MAYFNLDGWRSHASQNGPRLLSATLAALITVEMVRMVTTLAVVHPRTPGPPPVHSAPGRSVSPVDVARIVSMHLFGSVAVEPSDSDPTHAPLSTAALALTGTVATADPHLGRAILGEPGQTRVYAVGDRVGDLALRAVYPDRVILDRGGSLEALLLPRPASAAQWSVVPGSPTRPNAPPGVPTPGAAAPGATATPSNQPQEALVDKVAEWDVELDGASKPIGIRVVPGAERSTFIHSGLHGGDIIVAINGTRVDDGSDASQSLWKQVSTGARVTVLRGGSTQDVTVNFAP
jgi:general secretion pathway protein C